ncbi:MAG: hypothetical protein HY277_06035 [Ignavibacteriales bacterium]|nr:hypothetical protein [Ignavibacteriales bacterium]
MSATIQCIGTKQRKDGIPVAKICISRRNVNSRLARWKVRGNITDHFVERIGTPPLGVEYRWKYSNTEERHDAQATYFTTKIHVTIL